MADNTETPQERDERVAAENEERRKEAEQVSPHVRTGGENPNYGEPDEQGFVGVAPEYANYANETEAPLEGDGSEVEDVVVEPEDEKTDEAETPPQQRQPVQAGNGDI